jgi:phage repressor protein C with HTH and peptisase S24 domain
VVKTIEGEVMAKQLARRGAKKVELLSLNAAHGERTLNVEEISFIHRIIWASQ